VLDHYARFLQLFPTVEALAAAPLNSVLAAWSGLGYYRRARALHRAATEVVSRFGTQIPRSMDELRTLPGIGAYTAAAVASIAFGEPSAVVDGNVHRVLQRLGGRAIPPQQAWRTAQLLITARRSGDFNPGDFNQAMMELGATVCLPGEPRCHECPVRRFCNARSALKTKSRAARASKRTVAHSLAVRNKKVLLVQRPATATLMAGLWELPASALPVDTAMVLLRLRHAITTTNYTVLIVDGTAAQNDGRWVPLRHVQRLPLTGLTLKALRRANLLPIK
jgi:A/G-specific adenine glycosylase